MSIDLEAGRIYESNEKKAAKQTDELDKYRDMGVWVSVYMCFFYSLWMQFLFLILCSYLAYGACRLRFN